MNMYVSLLPDTYQHNFKRVAMAEWLARQTPNHKIVGSSPAKSQSLIKTAPCGLRVVTMVPQFTQP